MTVSRWFWVGLSLFALSGTAALASDASADRAVVAAKPEVRAVASPAGACSCSAKHAEFTDRG